MPRRALLLVDLQNDFLPGGALAVPGGDAVVAPAVELARQFAAAGELVIASQDWHPPDHSSFAVNHPGHKVGEVIDLHGNSQVLWPAHCVQNSFGAQLAAAIPRQLVQHVIQKGTDREIDSYSAFFDNGQLRATGLAGLLREHGVEELHLLGLATDYCVKFSALAARQLGFRTVLHQQACRGVNLQPGDSERALEEMRQAGVAIV